MNPILNDAVSAAATNPGFAAFNTDSKKSFVRPADAKAIAVAGYRHSVIRYRDMGKNTVTRPAKMVTIPQVILGDDYLLPEIASKLLIGVYEDAQDDLIRSMIDANQSMIDWETVSIDAVHKYLTERRQSTRLTKEQIAAWVKVAMLSSLTQRGEQIAVGKGYDELQSAQQVSATINSYTDGYSKLAAPVPNIGASEAKALNNMLLVSELDDDIARSLRAKLDAILNPKVLDEGNL